MKSTRMIADNVAQWKRAADGLRRLALAGTEWANAQVASIRTRLLKIGAVVRVSARRVWVSMATGYPWQTMFRTVWAALRC